MMEAQGYEGTHNVDSRVYHLNAQHSVAYTLLLLGWFVYCFSLVGWLGFGGVRRGYSMSYYGRSNTTNHKCYSV